MQISFEVLGEPKAKGRPRATKIGEHARMYTPTKTKRWESLIRDQAGPLFATPIVADVPVHVHLQFWFALPASQHRKRKPPAPAELPSREDWDNLGKLVCDALNGVAYVDDRQITLASALKMRCGQEDNRPRTVIVIEWEGEIDG